MRLGKLISKYYSLLDNMSSLKESDELICSIKEFIEKFSISKRESYMTELEENSTIDGVLIYHHGMNIIPSSNSSTNGMLGPAPRAKFYTGELNEELLINWLKSEYTTEDRNRLFALLKLCQIKGTTKELVEMSGANFNSVDKKLSKFKSQLKDSKKYRDDVKGLLKYEYEGSYKGMLLEKLNELDSMEI